MGRNLGFSMYVLFAFIFHMPVAEERLNYFSDTGLHRHKVSFSPRNIYYPGVDQPLPEGNEFSNAFSSIYPTAFIYNTMVHDFFSCRETSTFSYCNQIRVEFLPVQSSEQAVLPSDI